MSSPDCGYSPNFTSTHSVTVDQPIHVVFPIIGTSEGHERVCRLSPICTAFQLLGKDAVSLPAGTVLINSNVRTLPSSTSETALPRQAFTMTETVSVFGIKTDVHIQGTLTWDEEAKEALYETIVSASGIQVWKSRNFEEMEESKTRVTETIHGRCPTLLKRIVQGETSRSHK